MYFQVQLEKYIEDGRIEIVGWIPERRASPGSIIDLKEETGEWSRGWKVMPHSLKKENLRAENILVEESHRTLPSLKREGRKE